MAEQSEQLTRTQLIAQVRAAKPKSKEQRNQIVCALIGHSLIVEGCFGYVHCGRCGEQIGDQLAGVYADAERSVRVGHNCKVCRANYKKMDWRHKLYAPDPFKKAKATT